MRLTTTSLAVRSHAISHFIIMVDWGNSAAARSIVKARFRSATCAPNGILSEEAVYHSVESVRGIRLRPC